MKLFQTLLASPSGTSKFYIVYVFGTDTWSADLFPYRDDILLCHYNSPTCMHSARPMLPIEPVGRTKK